METLKKRYGRLTRGDWKDWASLRRWKSMEEEEWGEEEGGEEEEEWEEEEW